MPKHGPKGNPHGVKKARNIKPKRGVKTGVQRPKKR